MGIAAAKQNPLSWRLDGPQIARAILTRRRRFISKCERVLMVAPIFFGEIGFGRLA
jgi:hypothetical protein